MPALRIKIEKISDWTQRYPAKKILEVINSQILKSKCTALQIELNADVSNNVVLILKAL